MNKNLLLAKELIRKLELPMKVLSVEENEEEMLTYRFSSENRVDLSDLIKKIQEETERKVTMYQVGPRDEVKFLSSVGVCGRKLCCATFVKNPSAFSVTDTDGKGFEEETGFCGKIKCCLAYQEKKTAPEETKAPKTLSEEKTAPETASQGPSVDKPVVKPIIRVLPKKKARHRR